MSVRALPHLGRATGALVVAGFLATIFTPVSNVLAYWTSVPPGVGPAEAIVVLGAGASTPPGILDGPSLRKALYGIRLYHRGFAPLLVLSGGPDDGDQPGEASLRVELAQEMGVAVENIVQTGLLSAGEAPTTYTEALRVRTMIADTGIRTVLLVTDSQHMRRATYLFEQIGFSVLPAPIDEISLDVSSPEERLRLLRWISGEWLARLYYAAAR